MAMSRLPAEGLSRPLIEIDDKVSPFLRGATPRLDPLDADTIRLLKSNDALAASVAESRVLAATHFSDRLGELIRDPSFDIGTLRTTTLPGQLTGQVVDPASLPAKRLRVSIAEPFPSGAGPGSSITGDDGSFAIRVPEEVRTITGLASIVLRVVGATKSTDLEVKLADIDGTGSVGVIALPAALDPLPIPVVAQLADIVTGLATPGESGAPPTATGAQPALELGADVCTQVFRSDMSFDRFPYGVLVRLVEPRPSVGALAVQLKRGNRTVLVSAAFLATLGKENHPYSHAERLPIDQPVSVDAFRDGVAGITPGGRGSAASTVPIAGTLGLGYIVHMAQRWTPMGLSLGDLVYSLPLAPGEQQRIAIVDRRATSSVTDTERLEARETMAFGERDDASTRATFESGMREKAEGGSSFHTESESSSWGAAGGIGFALGPIAIGGGAAGGGGSANSNGSTNNWMSGVRNYTSTAAQASHSSVERSASSTRSLQRMGMRLASASERNEVVTKVIANHNRTHALTMQYWEVLRMFDVRSTVEGVSLVCFVPLDPVRFLPPGEPIALSDAALSRSDVLRRYSQLLNYADTLRRVIERPYRKGLAMLEEFAADPRATVQAPTDSATNIVTVHLQGTFLPYEDVRVTLLATGGRRLGPYPVPTGGIDGLPSSSDASQAFASEAELIAFLRRRRDGAPSVISRSVALPEWLARTDVVGIEVSRQFRDIRYHFPSTASSEIARLKATGFSGFDGIIDKLVASATPAHDVVLTPERLEAEVGGANLVRVRAALAEPSKSLNEAIPAGDMYLDEYLGGGEFGTAPLPFAATQLPPELRYSSILEIEKALQHAIANTVSYSKAIWMSLTPEERVMLLEGYTIGTADGVADDSQTIPLLACVANELLGFYGNSMVLPFMIPAPLVAKRKEVDGVEFTTASVQDALTRYHTTGFSPPVSTIALPTRGVLGEAVLGHCPSAEKIDLTRFWNWQDSPTEEASPIEGVTVPASSLTQGLQAPSALTTVAPAIQNFSTAGPAGDFGLLAELVKAGAAAKGFDVASLTGSSALADLLKATLSTAESARKDALAGAQAMATKAMDSIPNVINAKAGKGGGDTKPKEDDKPAQTADAPTVSELTPTHGKAGDKLAVIGTKLTGATKATVGGKPLGNLKVVDDTRIEGDVPPGVPPGAVDVLVTTPKGVSTASTKSKFTIDA
ncbi:hypothetical protein EDM22_00640 [Agromyces tardus]|uniref:Uncharacterized protein n=2 Tax=Agromyces tardus TaxID=2583849 RepID=A0A3M8AMJ9_9MICO|nr:hypothetical protein EDM22_00640 [Agromyces tardus]